MKPLVFHTENPEIFHDFPFHKPKNGGESFYVFPHGWFMKWKFHETSRVFTQEI